MKRFWETQDFRGYMASFIKWASQPTFPCTAKLIEKDGKEIALFNVEVHFTRSTTVQSRRCSTARRGASILGASKLAPCMGKVFDVTTGETAWPSGWWQQSRV